MFAFGWKITEEVLSPFFSFLAVRDTPNILCFFMNLLKMGQFHYTVYYISNWNKLAMTNSELLLFKCLMTALIAHSICVCIVNCWELFLKIEERIQHQNVFHTHTKGSPKSHFLIKSYLISHSAALNNICDKQGHLFFTNYQQMKNFQNIVQQKVWCEGILVPQFVKSITGRVSFGS